MGATLEQHIGELQVLIDNRQLDEAVANLNMLIATTPDDRLYFMRGKLMMKLGNHAAATTDFNHAIALNPESPARHALEMVRDITDFFNPDLLNP